jgi:type IV secretory pathway VirB10-like protein
MHEVVIVIVWLVIAGVYQLIKQAAGGGGGKDDWPEFEEWEVQEPVAQQPVQQVAGQPVQRAAAPPPIPKEKPRSVFAEIEHALEQVSKAAEEPVQTAQRAFEQRTPTVSTARQEARVLLEEAAHRQTRYAAEYARASEEPHIDRVHKSELQDAYAVKKKRGRIDLGLSSKRPLRHALLAREILDRPRSYDI